MVLEECRNFFAQKADSIKGWNDIDQNELVRMYTKYADNGNPLADSCLSAIIYKYWHVMTHRYNRQKKKIATEEDMLEMYIDSIKYVLDKRVWEDENNPLYGRDDAPNVAINVKLDSLIKNFILASTRHKRINDYNGISMSQFLEMSVGEDANCILVYEDDEALKYDTVNDFIIKYFNKKDYMASFMLDIICNDDVFSSEDGYSSFSSSVARKILRGMDDEYCKYFSDRYMISYDKVIGAISYITNMGYTKLSRSTDKAIYRLSKDKELISSLRCN